MCLGCETKLIQINGDVDGPVDVAFVLRKSSEGEHIGEGQIGYKDQTYAFVQVRDNSENFPAMFDTVVTYDIKYPEEHIGEVALKLDARTKAKKFEMSFDPYSESGARIDYKINMDMMYFSSGYGFKYDYELKIDYDTMEKGEGKFFDAGQKFELITKDTITVHKQSPFHWMNTMMTQGREWTTMEHSRNFFFDKVNKAHLINKMKLEEHNILDGRTWYHFKYDNTAYGQTAFLFTFLPHNMEHAWTYEGGSQHRRRNRRLLKIIETNFTLTHKITHGENVIQEGEMVFDVKANDGSKFEMEHLHKITMTDESPFYALNHWYTGRYGKNVERKMTVFYDKSFLFFTNMKMDTTLTLDGEKINEFVFDNTQAKKHIKFFWAPDAFTKDYLFTNEWEFTGMTGIKWSTDLKRGGVSVWNYVGDYSWVNNANKFEIKMMDKIVQTPMSPFYGWDHFLVGIYYKDGERTRTITYDKQSRNFLLGKLFVEDKIMAEGEKFYHIKVDTRATPYTMVWFHQPVRGLLPTTRDVTGQDEMIVSAWHNPGKELKIETNLPEFKTTKVTSTGPTKKFELNGKEVATVDFDPSSKKASSTMHLPNGKDLVIDLAWPKMTVDASDLEFGVTITPDRKVVTKFGWKWAGVKKVYLDVIGNNPWIGDYKLSRRGEFQEVSGSLYKIKWTGHGKTTKGFLRRVSPVETNVVASVNTRNLKLDAIVWKSFAGQKYGFTMNNDKFTLLGGEH